MSGELSATCHELLAMLGRREKDYEEALGSGDEKAIQVAKEMYTATTGFFKSCFFHTQTTGLLQQGLVWDHGMAQVSLRS